MASRDDAQGGGRSKAEVEAIGPRHSQYLNRLTPSIWQALARTTGTELWTKLHSKFCCWGAARHHLALPATLWTLSLIPAPHPHARSNAPASPLTSTTAHAIRDCFAHSRASGRVCRLSASSSMPLASTCASTRSVATRDPIWATRLGEPPAPRWAHAVDIAADWGERGARPRTVERSCMRMRQRESASCLQGQMSAANTPHAHAHAHAHAQSERERAR